MTVLITLTTAGSDSGPFDLYSNLDGYISAFETGVSKSSLVAGYASSLVPDYTTIIKVLSTGTCTNYINIPVEETTTTTTSSTSTTTTTTTTEPPVNCIEVGVYPPLVQDSIHTVTYLVCPEGTQNTVNVPYEGTMIAICTSAEGIISDNKEAVVAQTYPTGNICSGETTTTSSTTTTSTTTITPPSCYFYNVTIDPADLADATGNTDTNLNNKVFISYIDCSIDGNPQNYEASSSGVFTNAFCGIQTTTYAFYYKNDAIQYTAASYATTDLYSC